jgi:hypothetical protein
VRAVVRLQEEPRGDLFARSRERKMFLFKEADEATGGEICKNIDAIIREEANFVKNLLADSMHETITPPTGRGPIELKQVRTEIERLLDYIDFSHMCRGESV